MPTQDPVVMPDNGVTPPVDGGMGAPAMDPPTVTPPATDGGMGDAPVADPVTPPVDGGMGAPAEGEEKPADDAPVPM